MNKIYKVIWSKVRNCYVAVSEIAKRNGKSCTSVNCGAKVNRRCIALGLAIATFCAVPMNAMAANSGGTTDSEGSYVGDSPNYNVKIDSGHSGDVYGRKESGSVAAENAKVTITAGTVTGKVYGGYNYIDSTTTYAHATGNSISISGGTVNATIYGGYSFSKKSSTPLSDASNNTITISGTATINGHIYGGYANYGNTSGNTINITGGTFTNGYIDGSFTTVGNYGDNCNNTVTLAGGEFTRSSRFDIQAARGGGAKNDDNTLNLYGTVKGLENAWLFGIGDITKSNKNNELHIGGTRSGEAVEGTTLAPWTGTTGNKVARIYEFNNIVLHKVKWDTTTPVLAAGQFIDNFTNEGYYNRGYLDISGMTFTGTPNYGEMALLSSDISNDFKTLKVKYNSGDPVTLNSENLKLIRQSGTQKTESAFQKGVKLTYKEKEHTVSLKNSYRSVVYSIADNVTGITFGNMTWGTGRDLSQEENHFAFDKDTTTINASNLTFSEKEYSFGNTTGIITTNSEMTLLANATGITSGNSVTQPSSGKGTVPIKYVDGSFTINATASGTVSAASDSAKYTVNSVKVDKVTLGENLWGQSSGLGSMWGWETSSSTNIDATGLTYRKRTSGSYAAIRVNDTSNILTASGLSLATVTKPTTNDGKVIVPLEVYETTTTTNPITYNATAYGDVIVESNTIKTKITSVALDKVTLGSFGWGSSRTMPSIWAWTASDSTKIDDTNFAYTGTASDKLIKNDTRVILNATGLTTGSSVIRDGGASAIKTVAMDFTDSSGDGASGIRFTGTVNGHVAAAADKVNYVVDGATLDSINLVSWNGSNFSLKDSDWGWNLATSGSAITATVATGTGTNTMTPPSGLNPGQTQPIVTATGLNFTGIEITGDYVWGEGTDLEDNLTVGGVTIGGKQTKSGVKVNEANTSQLVYEQSKKKINTLTLGNNITFANDDNTSSTVARTFDENYDLTTASIDTNALAFTNSEIMEEGNSMRIVDASAAIKDGSGHALKAFTSETKTSFDVGYTDSIAGKGLTFTGTHTDTLSQDTNLTKIIYTVGNKKAGAATLTGGITWDTSQPYYENTKYTFNTDAATNLDGLSIGTVSADPYGQSMTLIKGKVKGTVTNAPASFGASVNKTYTTLGATAAGSAAITSSGDLTYSVDGVRLDTITVNSVGDTYDTVPANWTLKSGATVDASGMTVPSGLSVGEKKPIIVQTASGITDYFAGVTFTDGNKWTEGSDLPTTLTTINGVSVTGTQTQGGVKVNELDKNQIVYESSKKNITAITLDTVPEFKYDGTAARTFDSEYDVSTATITATNFKFADTSPMEAGDAMTIVDATSAISYPASGPKLTAFDTITYSNVAFADTITDPTHSSTADNIKFTGQHTDTLSQDTAKTKLTYTVGGKVVDTATLSGPIAWSDGGTYYTNGTAVNQKGRNSVFTFDSNSKIDISGVRFSATTDPLNKTMTLISGNTISSVAKNVAGTITNGTPYSFVVSLAKNNTTLKATATDGEAKITSGNLTYTVTGVTMDTIDVTSIANAADTVPTGWNLASGASVETDNLVIATSTGLAPGETKPIITSTVTDYFNGVTVKGSHAWQVDGSDITADLDIGGVAITGTQTKGGVKVNEANTRQIIYEESKKKVNTLTLGKVTFTNDDGTAATVARSFDATYDVSTAPISAGSLSFSNSEVMETGNTMRIVDASAALPNAITGKNMPVFTAQDYTVNYTDTISGKIITFAGTHADKLEQDAAQTKLTYTVGDKVVKTATLNGTINWSDGTSYYTNGSDVNQNNVAATYKFDGNTSVNISNVSFSATADPLVGATKTMTLLKGVNGVAAGKVSGTPSFTVTLDQANTKLDAKATGSATVSGNDVTYTVSGVAIDKVNVKSVGSTADTVPANWTLATGASVETDSMTTPSGMNPGETRAIITATGTDYFNGITINGSRAWKVDGSTLTADLEVGGVTVAGTQTRGGVKVDETNKNQLIYEETKKKLTSITLGEVTFANGGTARTFDNTYDATEATINADGLKFTDASSAAMETGNTMTIVDASAAFKDASGKALVAFADKTYTLAFSETNTEKNVTVAGTHTDTLSQDAAKTKLTYTVGMKDVKTVDIGKVDFVKGSTLFDRSGAGYNYAGVAALGTGGFAVAYASPETVTAGDSMTLLQANATLKDMAEQVKKTSYSFAPVSGVTIDANITGKLVTSGGAVTYTATENQASKLTFTNVDWKDSGALLTRPSNITFAGADVDTAKINFTNITLLDANKQMTLVSDFGDKVGTITGTKYMVGTTSEGEGVASLSGSDLIFTTKTGAGGAAEQTHRTVMATEAGIAALAAGQEYVDSAVEGLGMLTNLSPDGTSTFAAMGGGASRYKTGSHVDTRTWNAVVAVGSKREHKKGTFEWGVFAEYGKGNYTLHSDDGGRGDGDTHYAGGGLLAKWTNKHKVYTEASVRMGRISDSASNMLRDGAGNQYGYNVHANYYGGHIGIGKLFEVKKNRELDVYGKFFYTRRNGVSFNAAGRYDLDAVNSSLLRVGARYGSTDKKWNWYGGLAYEYQFDGESGGMLNGNTPIRAASIKGGSVRGEIGLRMDATETNPWKVDFSIYGYGGKHRGIGGSVNVAYMF